MTGADIIGALLVADETVTTMVPAERIKAGLLPPNILLPSLLVRLVSSLERQTLVRGASVRMVDRISVTVRASTYRDQVEMIRLVRAACAGWLGDMAPASKISVLSAGVGPDVPGPGNSFEQTIDFRVSFNVPA
ncbi:hypothetical protein HMF7854_04450 [Sphingomonas ginkgonis]|uniref:DUF3168 domain-containing protein n=1 Tax=Sphingomonas ginkgonis TaxID=2315330 RepID=A0A429V892_9SPHN|nr:hypothetical protein [Sphingomonas ginkgonis]RST30159.1 hypothetical protein HMF7854_04450 [Sphingomonas ginkgonis]